MKSNLFIKLSLALLLMPGCANDKTEKTGSQTARQSASETATSNSNPEKSKGEGVVGTWKMSQEAWDKNENRVMEDEERKTATGNNYTLQLNEDGSCKIQGVYSGSYKVKQEGNKKMLEVQRKKVEGEETTDPPPDVYIITSMTSDEMVLMLSESGTTSSFWIFKRI